MALDIDKLIHQADFDLNTEALGVIRCGPFSRDDLSKFDKMARTNQVDGEALARGLILSIARKLTGEDEIDRLCGGAALTEEEVAEISPSEVDDFCNQFVPRRLRIGPDEHPCNTDAKPGKYDRSQLASAIIAHTDSQQAQLKRILGQTRAGIVGGSIAEAAAKFGISGETAAETALKYGIGGTAAEIARKYGVGETAAEMARRVGIGETAAETALKYGIGGTAAEMARKYGVGETAAEIARKVGIGETVAEMARKYGIGETLAEATRRNLLGSSALDSALRTIKASDNLGESIAALRASEMASIRDAEPIELKHFTQPNPILETNRLLKRQQAYAEEMRPAIIRSAELIQTLTDTSLATQAFANNNSAQAERHAKRSMWIAIGSIIISVVASGFSIYYANESPTSQQAEQLAKDLKDQIKAVTLAAKADREAFEKSAKEDRATLAAAIKQQAELTKAINDNYDKMINSRERK